MGKGRILKIYETRAVFENLDSDQQPCLLVTQKENGKLFDKFHRKQHPDLGPSFQIVPFEMIFGFYELLSGSYVALVVESEPYVSHAVMDMRRAKKIIVIPLFRNFRTLSEAKQRDEDRYLQLLNFALSSHSFYYSYTSDITHTQQRLAKLQLSNNSSSKTPTNESLWTRADLRFFWNRDVLEELVVNEAHDWITPVMSAYIEMRSDCTIDADCKFTLLFISRRSKYRQGCRFTKRGLDEYGNPANFSETEQILLFPDGKLTSYVQIRGSIPLKWTSPVHMRYDPAVFLDDRQKSTDSCMLHIQDIVDKYQLNSSNSNLILINLIDHKKDQGKLGTEFKEVIDVVKTKFFPLHLYYCWFDFHHETKQKGKWNNLSKLVLQLDELFRAQKYFCRTASGEITSWQTGIIRTNCMDNLDRTNVVQCLFARRSLIFQIQKEKTLDLAEKHIMDTPWKNFEAIFKGMWTNNANAMSLGYAGTGALKVDFTKTGKRTFKGMFNDGVNSCMRYYINNFTDGIKQDAIDLMLGVYRPNIQNPSPFSYRTSQEALINSITKVFVLLIFIFATLSLFIPPIVPLISSAMAGGTTSIAEGITGEMSSVEILEKNFKHLQTHFLVALVLTMAILTYLGYSVVKRGSKIGEMMVIHPELCPEALPVGRVNPAAQK
jgi:hypothetical protein